MSDNEINISLLRDSLNSIQIIQTIFFDYISENSIIKEDPLLIGRADIVSAHLSDLYMAIGNKIEDLENVQLGEAS